VALEPPATFRVWQTIAEEAERESALWGAALRPPVERDETPVFSPLGEERYALGVETIYEGYLLHYGRSRLFAPADADAGLLLGDYLYAHGLVRVAELGDVDAIADLAELLAACAYLRAEGRPGDGAAWAAAVALLGRRQAKLDPEEGEAAWLDLAEAEAGADAVATSLTVHAELVRPTP
jgi:hypothetical protein